MGYRSTREYRREQSEMIRASHPIGAFVIDLMVYGGAAYLLFILVSWLAS